MDFCRFRKGIKLYGTMSANTANPMEKVFVIDAKGRKSSKTLMDDAEIEKRGKEMGVVLKLIRNLDFCKSQVLILAHPEEVEENPEFLTWYQDPQTKREFFEWLFTNNHKVGGKEGEWANGWLGSRWCDKRFNGKACRIAFYDKTELKGLREEGKYKLMICAL